ncbi:hypothetical protein ACFSJD_34810, partial [Pseudonocardia yunnanensis]
MRFVARVGMALLLIFKSHGGDEFMSGRENMSSPFGDERLPGLQRRMVLKAGLGTAAATAFGALTS